MSGDRVWLRHTEHGGAFHAPAEAVEAWAAMGWVPGEPPEEHNPAVAENLAAQAAAEREAAAQAAPSNRKSSVRE
jgi:hypothetical protein